MAKFTAATAREMLARSIVARKRNAELRRNPPPQPPLIPPPKTESIADQQSILILAHVQRVHGMIRHAADAQEMERLGRALSSLLGCWRDMVGMPAAGQRKPGVEKPGRRGRPSAGPVDVQEEPTPQPVV